MGREPAADYWAQRRLRSQAPSDVGQQFLSCGKCCRDQLKWAGFDLKRELAPHALRVVPGGPAPDQLRPARGAIYFPRRCARSEWNARSALRAAPGHQTTETSYRLCEAGQRIAPAHGYQSRRSPSVAQAKNHNILKLTEIPGGPGKFLRCPEKKRAVNAQDRHV